ncbi:MAG: glycerol-3-phosphate acyltransferase [Lachnospiraceae bacterium]|nr:glycerol-3-phosphate acyltransferase [Lachnospiraceae bacterium]
MEIAGSVLIGYLIGGFNPSFVIAKIKGFDIRKSGSGNAGGSNALITMGRIIGVFCMIFDIFKSYFAIWLSGLIAPEFEYVLPVCGTSCILGHVFPVYMKFRGGKGLACLGGVVLAFSPAVFGIMFASELVLALLFDYICVVPITASIVFPIVYGLMTDSATGAMILAISSLVIILKHVENLRRISEGREMHLSYLWKGKKEVDRVLKNMQKDL